MNRFRVRGSQRLGTHDRRIPGSQRLGTPDRRIQSSVQPEPEPLSEAPLLSNSNSKRGHEIIEEDDNEDGSQERTARRRHDHVMDEEDEEDKEDEKDEEDEVDEEEGGGQDQDTRDELRLEVQRLKIALTK